MAPFGIRPRTTPSVGLVDSDQISFSARLRHLAGTVPDRPAVTIGSSTTTFAELDQQTDHFAHHLRGLGVGMADFVTIASPNSLEFIIATTACWRLGAVPQPVSSRLPGRELEAIVELADSAAVVGVEYEGRPWVPHGFVPDREVGPEVLTDRVSPAWKAPTSGGSTGRPKLIVSGDPSLYGPATQNVAAMIGIEAASTMVMPGPLYHNGPFIWSLVTLLEGGHLVLLPRFDAEGTLAAIQDHKGTALYLVPTMMQRIWKLPDDVKFAYDLTSLRRAFHLAEPCPAWLKEAWIEWIGSEVLWELYGGTEGQSATVLSGTEWLTHRGSVGRPSSGEMKICDEEGNDLPTGEIGDVWMRPVGRDTPTYRYIGAEPETREGWDCLGDMGWMDEEGYLYLADRRTDMILVGGANIYPAEIEAALNEHPDVHSCAVIGLPDEDMGNRVHAIVQGSPASEDELRSFLGDRLVGYKVPRTFEFVDEALRDDAGKMRRSALRSERLPT